MIADAASFRAFVTRAFLLTLLCLVVLAAPAAAQDPADATRGPETLASRGVSNAENACRRQGVCESREAAVAAHEKSSVAGALDFQFRLGHALPLRNAPWVGTHNSANSASEDVTLSGSDHNQQLSLRDQLRLDVRSLELDVHWFPSRRAGGAHAPVVCHARGANEMHAGCSDERLLSERLPEIASWLEANPGEVLLLYLEDHLFQARGSDADHGRAHDAGAAVLESQLGRYVYRPTGGCTVLPTELTRQAVLDAGKQVLLVAKGCGVGSAWPGLVFDFRPMEVEERPVDFTSCTTDFSAATYDAKMVRYYEDSTVVSATLWPTGASSLDDGLTPETTRKMVGCGVDLFGFDQLLPDDGRLAALVWAWAPARDRCAALDTPWAARKCQQERRFGCRDAAGGWVVAGPAAPWSDGAAACAAAGASFVLPRSGAENAALLAAAAGERVWVASAGPAKKSKRSRSKRLRAAKHRR